MKIEEFLLKLYPNGIPVERYDNLKFEIEIGERLFAQGGFTETPPAPESKAQDKPVLRPGTQGALIAEYLSGGRRTARQIAKFAVLRNRSSVSVALNDLKRRGVDVHVAPMPGRRGRSGAKTLYYI